jgi:hypothetical protein
MAELQFEGSIVCAPSASYAKPAPICESEKPLLGRGRKPMKRILCLCVAILLMAGTATVFAADITGTWTGTVKGPDGNEFPVSFTFKLDGTTLTGTVQGPQGDPIAISDGKVDNDKISFNVSFNGMTIKHEGTIAGDEIKLTTKADQGDFPGGELILKRSK